MNRASMVAGGTLVGAAAVMVIPQPGKPQQVSLAGNSAAGGAASAGTTPAAAPGTSSGTGSRTVAGSLETTQYGRLEVKLTVKSGRITDVGFTTFVANDGHSASIDQYAAPILIRETIAAQSAHVQGVSGATYTSGAYEQSLQAAIDKAGLKA
jgi:uncharacterized protein with FMN-binding domain